MGVNKVVFGAVSIMDISDSTVTPDTLAKDAIAYGADGERIVGTMEEKADPVLQEKTATPTTSSQTITPDSGYDGLSKVTVSAMPTATQATPSISVSSGGLITASATQSAGYVAAGTKSATKQLTVQAAQTITPGTSNKTIASGRYLTGTQTIKGDANLVAENIAEGVSIFGVTGTHAGGGDTSAEDGIIERTLTEITNARVSKIGSCAFYMNSVIAGVDFPAVTYIGSSAFYRCSSLTSANFPAAQYIGYAAISSCIYLRNVNFSAVETISSCAFYACSRMTAISFPAATTIGASAFYYCASVTDAYLPLVTVIADGLFRECRSLTNVYCPKATSIGRSAFAICDRLSSINLPAVTTISSSAFSQCGSLTTVVLGASTVCSLAESAVFSGTNMKKSGWFYVPSSLVAAYQTATNWAYFSSRFSAIEDM